MRIRLAGGDPRGPRLGSTKACVTLQENTQSSGHDRDVLLADAIGSCSARQNTPCWSMNVPVPAERDGHAGRAA
jgi:hypothetical protein